MVVPMIAYHLVLTVSQISRCGTFQYIRELFGFLRLFYTFLESVLKEQEAAKCEPPTWFASSVRLSLTSVVAQSHKYPVC